MAARQALITKTRTLLRRQARESFRHATKIRVEKSDYRDYVHVYVTTNRFERMPMRRRGALIWRWLESGLTPKELVKITLVLPLTPKEEKFYGTAS
jgi:hypothetical protein